MTAFLAEYLRETTVPELELCAVLAWSVTRFQAVLDSSSMWLSALQAQQAAEAGQLYVEVYAQLAARAMARAQPRYYIRPKLHSVACETIGRLRQGSKFNPRYVSCWQEEDFVGKLCARAKAAIHPGSLSRRLLQRSLLYLNSWLATL